MRICDLCDVSNETIKTIYFNDSFPLDLCDACEYKEYNCPECGIKFYLRGGVNFISEDFDIYCPECSVKEIEHVSVEDLDFFVSEVLDEVVDQTKELYDEEFK